MKIRWKCAAPLILSVLLWIPVCGGTALAASQTEIAGAEEKIALAASQGKESVDLSGYNIMTDEIENVYNSARENNTALSFVTNVSWSYNTSSQKVIKLTLTYLDTAVNIKQMNADYEAAVNEALAIVDDGMSDAEKAAAIHDYLILSTVRADEGDISKTPYSVLALNKGKPIGLIYAFKDLMTRLGIACIVVYSADTNSAWNMVQIDGTWYHMDLSSDDPLCPSSSGWHNEDTKMLGRVKHTYFLLSDETLKGLGRTSWVSGLFLQEDRAPQAASKLYEGRYGEITSGMFYSDGYWYYSLTGVLTRSRFDLSEAEALPATGSVGFISLAEGWLYYLSTATDGATKEIRRISTDGTEDMSVVHVGTGDRKTEEVTEILIEDGCLNYMVYATDASGSAQYAARSLKLSLIASGVEDGGVYNSERNITFAEGTALLDGTEVQSGATVSSEGEHTFVITDTAGDTRTLSFLIDTTAPVISGIENGASYDRTPAITFNEGVAILDGELLESGGNIVKGEHTLIVTDPAGNASTVRFTVLTGSFAQPAIIRFAFVPVALLALFPVFLLLKKRAGSRAGKRSGGPEYPSEISGESVPSPNPAKVIAPPARQSEPSRTAAPIVSAPAVAGFPPNIPNRTAAGGNVLYCGECGAKNDCENRFCGACSAELYKLGQYEMQPLVKNVQPGTQKSAEIAASGTFKEEIPTAVNVLPAAEPVGRNIDANSVNTALTRRTVGKIRHQLVHSWQLFSKKLSSYTKRTLVFLRVLRDKLTEGVDIRDFSWAGLLGKKPGKIARILIAQVLSSKRNTLVAAAVVLLIVVVIALPGKEHKNNAIAVIGDEQYTAMGKASVSEKGSVSGEASAPETEFVSVDGSSFFNIQGDVRSLTDEELAKVKEFDAQVDEHEVNTIGNTPGNISSGGMVAEQGGWIYYVSVLNVGVRDNGYCYLYKSRPDGSERTKLSDLNINSESDINVVGDWIYFHRVYEKQTENGHRSIGINCKIRTDGTDYTIISNKHPEADADNYLFSEEHFIVVGDRLYSIDIGGDGISLKTDGTGYGRYTFQGLSTTWEWSNASGHYVLPGNYIDMNSYFFVDNGKFYFQNGGYDIKKNYKYLCSVNLDGSSYTPIKAFDDNFKNFIIDGEWLYTSIDNKLCKISLSGDEVQTVLDQFAPFTAFNVYKDWVYYIDSNSHHLCRIRTNGSEQEVLLSENFWHEFNIHDDWIYLYVAVNDEDVYGINPNTLCRMRTDGTLLQVLEND